MENTDTTEYYYHKVEKIYFVLDGDDDPVQEAHIAEIVFRPSLPDLIL